MNSRFITFEGGEGAGKTSVLMALSQYFKDRGLNFIITREPGGIDIAEKIRSVILDKSHVTMDERTEALLYAAARRQHLVERVVPALTAGKFVLCDRFVDSSLAYQGFARGIGFDEIYMINQFAIDNCMPGLTLYFDIAPEIGMQRIAANNLREVNRLDLEHIEFHEKVRNGYLQLVEKYPNRIKVINANQCFEDVLQQSIDIIENYRNTENV